MADDQTWRSVIKDLETQFDNQEECDVMFKVGEKTIGAHKFMLRARNRTLYDMAASWNLGDQPIPMEVMDYDSFKALIKFIYTDEVHLTNENVFIFLYAASKFQMPLLEKLCADYMSNSLNTENVCTYMDEALNFKSTILQERCKQFFSEQTDKVLEEPSFLETSLPALSALLDTENTDVLEIEIFGGIKHWMTKRCHDLKLPVNGTNMREVIGDALYKLRFPTMTVQDFANSVAKVKGLLSNTEMAQVFQMITTFDTSDVDCPFPSQFRCQKNWYYTPFEDMAQLMKHQILYNNVSQHYSDIKSMLEYIENISNGEPIKVTSLRIILQCCADLANSSGRIDPATFTNQAIRKEIKDDFNAWQGVVSTETNHETMTEYLQIRRKLDQICAWL